jgi:hypothetical protein
MSALVKVLRFDRGGEYLSEEFISHLQERGTHHKLRAMLHDSGLPKFLCGEAMQYAMWLKNRTSTKALNGQTPNQAMTGTKLNLAGLQVWGWRVWVARKGTSGLKSLCTSEEGSVDAKPCPGTYLMAYFPCPVFESVCTLLQIYPQSGPCPATALSRK